MNKKIIAIAALLVLPGCIATPRFEIAENFTFDYEMPSQVPMSYNDLLCCYDCHA